ncbi:MAG TPA: DNA polymerase IV [Bacillus sp. (in: firmicutes)]|uniref:DNA polymerase IV n=1 Tax=Bacillus litorisediminis TaxID=2922713 RepID=UPI001FAF19B5|nr:DNA polymerase IV [Bacillus litorisediminis]HWO76181.1 DNA polymerase IV [Bacillus sp. (in: firmicutes)]
MESKARVIFHIDMNSFYASVETAFHPELKGLPLAIAGNAKERRGIIVTCSYEARKFGVKATMPIWEAKKLCPHLIVREPDFDKYRSVSKKMFRILEEYTEWVEPVSIDEGYMDVTEAEGKLHPILLAETIQKRLLDELQLPCSIGIAPNKFLAKMASDMKKPLGITVLRKRDINTKLWPLEIQEMHGIGKKTAEKLRKMGMQTIGDLANQSELTLKVALGINGKKLWERANGIDRRKVDPESVNEIKSVGNSTTLPRDTDNIQEIYQILERLTDRVSKRLIARGYVTEGIQVTIRYFNRKTVTRSMTLNDALYKTEDLFYFVKQLFSANWNHEPIRLLGVTANHLLDKKSFVQQLDLFSFEKEEKQVRLQETLQKLNAKHGDAIIRKGIERRQ